MKAAIVGCGNIAKVHAACLGRMEETELAAVADCKIERARELAELYGCRAYESLEEMLQEEQIDVLHICTPHYLHTPMAVYALEHGVHVFMEKPPVISFEQLSQLKSIHTEKKLGFCFQNRYNPSVLKIKEILASGAAGRIIAARGIVTWSRDEAYYTESDWRGSLAKEGGGVLINQSIHTLDLLNYLIQKQPQTVDAVMTNHHLKGIIEVEDTLSAYITYPDTKVSFYATTAYAVNSAPFIELECENMRIRMEEMELHCYYPDGSCKEIDVEKKAGLGKSYWGAGHEDCIRDFYCCLKENRRFNQDLAGVEDILRIMLLIYQSGRSGEEQKWIDE